MMIKKTRDPKRLSLILTMVGLSLSIILSGCLRQRDVATSETNHSNRANAAWLGVEWLSEPHTPAQIGALADDLRQRQIRHTFVYASYLKPDGHFNCTYWYSPEFLRALKAADPDITVEAWIGLPLAYVDLAGAAVRELIVALCVDLIRKEGFDGIHLDPEPIANGDTDVLALLSELRRGIGRNATISIATRRIWPIPFDIGLPIIDKFVWKADYYRKIAQHVDRVVVMVYDSGLPLACLYRRWVSRQVIRLSRVLENEQAEVYVGVPTSEERTLTHWPNAENMTSGLQGVIDGLNNPNARPPVVTGVAIYPYWETDANEWAAYQALWLKQR